MKSMGTKVPFVQEPAGHAMSPGNFGTPVYQVRKKLNALHNTLCESNDVEKKRFFDYDKSDIDYKIVEVLVLWHVYLSNDRNARTVEW